MIVYSYIIKFILNIGKIKKHIINPTELIHK